MNPSLTVADPLAGLELCLTVTLPAGDQLHAARPVLVSLGSAERPPVIMSGQFGDLTALIAQAWTTFGIQVQLATAAPPVAQTSTVVAEAPTAAATAEETPAGAPEAPTSAEATPAQPMAKNLSLF